MSLFVLMINAPQARDNGVYRVYPCAECLKVGPGYGCNDIPVHPVIPSLVIEIMATWAWLA